MKYFQIKGHSSFINIIGSVLIISLVISLLLSCKKSSLNPDTNSPDLNPLKDVATFPIGAAVNPYLLQNNTMYEMTVRSQFSSITSENVLKFDWIEPQQNNFDFSNGDYLLSYSIAHNQRFHGHNLIWGQGLPYWVKQFQGDSASWEQLFRNHIQTEVSHY